eukprot:COSAG01_NODE_41240_length_454_cov_0.583099_1_plen_97_part_00
MALTARTPGRSGQWVSRWNLAIGIPDTMMMFGDDCFGSIIGRLNMMPMMILAAKLCPPGVEATLFALNMGLSNFGSTVGGYLGIGAASAAPCNLSI